MTMKMLVPMLLGVSLMTGCYGPKMQVGSRMVYAKEWESDSGNVKERATFESKCPPEKLTITILKTMDWNDGYAEQIGVEACGQRMVYVKHVGSSGGWVLNSAEK